MPLPVRSGVGATVRIHVGWLGGRNGELQSGMRGRRRAACVYLRSALDAANRIALDVTATAGCLVCGSASKPYATRCSQFTDVRLATASLKPALRPPAFDVAADDEEDVGKRGWECGGGSMHKDIQTGCTKTGTGNGVASRRRERDAGAGGDSGGRDNQDIDRVLYECVLRNGTIHSTRIAHAARCAGLHSRNPSSLRPSIFDLLAFDVGAAGRCRQVHEQQHQAKQRTPAHTTHATKRPAANLPRPRWSLRVSHPPEVEGAKDPRPKEPRTRAQGKASGEVFLFVDRVRRASFLSSTEGDFV
ncbi:hypothetical protein C8F04DRAFT_1199901 [Mycena alexandri]|uniref:Uncharacterized protein n=1 Tax=Mycena alexandri TaxID=1745969 RepID=A0AAD6WM79_9AGAR|nr:hypothetical protein C8F04DRAFT_1199901 [Mycena alexandri]